MVGRPPLFWLLKKKDYLAFLIMSDAVGRPRESRFSGQLSQTLINERSAAGLKIVTG
jgi:hypothetical protein